ncbi:MAG: hypothetical protein LH624_13195 [Cryobacterium sp.]|nr:hypothetical protein [Cryobacterium sp.]
MAPDVVDVQTELRQLRRGQALARPQAGLALSDELRRHLVGARSNDADAALAVVAALRAAAARLSTSDRRIVETELNLNVKNSHPTLTERQEALAAELRCAAKTVRRHSDRAITSLALVVASGVEPLDTELSATTGEGALRRFWRLDGPSEVEVVCSEIPSDERPAYALPGDRNYLRYAKFADLDTLMFVRSRLTQLAPRTPVRDFAPSEHHDSNAAAVIVIGGPPWNAKYREFLPQLPYHFEPHPLGEDDPLIVPMLGCPPIGPSWTRGAELVDDVGVFTRLTLASGTTIFLLGGCLTTGVLGAARTFLHSDVAPANVAWVDDRVGSNDVVVIVEVRRLGGMTDAADIVANGPLVALARTHPTGRFEVVEDNTSRR